MCLFGSKGLMISIIVDLVTLRFENSNVFHAIFAVRFQSGWDLRRACEDRKHSPAGIRGAKGLLVDREM